MSYHKLLEKQIRKYLPGACKDPQLEKLLSVINDSYNAYELDRELSDRAFRISEDEYSEINLRLIHELEVKRQSVEKLKETIGTITGEEKTNNKDDLLMIARYLNQQVNKRRSAELVFTSLISNMQSGILLEDETRHIVFTNQRFCDLFQISAAPEMLQGADCSNSAEESKYLFKDPEDFVLSIAEILSRKELVNNQLIELKDGRVFERDYIPIFHEGKYKGHLWSYTDITEKKKSELELKASQERWQFALEGAGDGVWEYDFETKDMFFSKQYKKMLGFEEEEFKNGVIQWKSRIHPDDLAMIEQTNRDYFNNRNNSHQREYRMKHKNGHYLWILDRGKAVDYTAAGRTKRVIGTHTDITAIKQTEKALRESEVQFRSLAENIPGILYKYEYSAEGKESFTYISPDSETKIGVSADELQRFYEILHPDDVEREHNVSRISRARGIPYHFEGRFVIPDKPLIWLNLSSSFSHINADGARVYTGVILNITKEKEAEIILQMRERKYRNIIANMNLGLLEVDNDESIQFANQSFCEMSGYSLAELIGQKASVLFVRTEDHEMMDINHTKRKKGMSDAYEILARTKSGEEKWWLISGAPRYNDQGEMIGSIGIHLDITDQKKLEHELVEAREQAESSSRAKQSFLANMSHEIRTPMNAILGMANQLAKTSLTKDQQFYLNTIHSAADNLLIIINDILDLSKIEAGKLSLEQIGFEPRMVIGRAMQVMNHKAEEKGLALTNSFINPKLSPVLVGDPYRLNQILINLLSNAVKFTEKGSVDISCDLVEELNGEQRVLFAVRDTGIGMDESFAKNLFKKFTQEDESVTRRFGGTGLGMSITKELIEMMGGVIQCKSRKGEGTTVSFSIQFNKGTAQQLPVKETGHANTSILEGKRILVTDDNEMNRLVATIILKNYGAGIEEAQNGQEAIEMLEKRRYDMVLMDVQMPVMDGVEATRIIRQRISKTLPVIALTALAIKGDQEKFLSAGMNDYLSKPFEENQLLRVVSRWMGEKEPNLEPAVKKENRETLFDLSKLEIIAKGNHEFIEKMKALFSQQGPATVAEIWGAYRQKDYGKVSKLAHRLKTSIDNMGISCLKEEIREIEHQAEKYRDAERLNKLIVNLDQVIKEVVEQLNAGSIATG